MIKIYSGHGAEIHDLSTTSFRSASAIPSTNQRRPACPQTAQGESL